MSNTKTKPIVIKSANFKLCKESFDMLEDMSFRLGCTKSQIVRYLILHYGNKLK